MKCRKYKTGFSVVAAKNSCVKSLNCRVCGEEIFIGPAFRRNERGAERWCGTCEHYNMFYIQDDPKAVRGLYGECIWPHRLHVDPIDALKTMRECGDIKQRIVWRTDACVNHMWQQSMYLE